MVFYRRKKAPYKKRPYKRRSTVARRRPRTYIRKPLTVGFPKTMTVKMRYVQEISIDPVVNTVTTTQFLCNSIFDPWWTVGGHQPMGHDEYAALYSNYYVTASKIWCRPNPKDTNAHIGGLWNIVRQDKPDTYAGFGWAQVLEQQSVNPYGFVPYAGSLQQQGHAKPKRSSFNARRQYKVKDLLAYEDGGAIFGASPVQQPAWAIMTVPVNANDAAAFTFEVIIEYTVLLTKPKIMSVS